MTPLKDIIVAARRRGNTYFILRAAALNPDCVIVFGSQDMVNHAKKLYHDKVLKELPLWLKLYRFFTGKRKKQPTFVTTTSKGAKLVAASSKKPVIVDSHSILMHR